MRCLICVYRRSNTRPRAIREGTAGMKRCETPPMSLLPARCSGGLTALKTNTPTAQATAERRLSIHTGPETGTEVRHGGHGRRNGSRSQTNALLIRLWSISRCSFVCFFRHRCSPSGTCLCFLSSRYSSCGHLGPIENKVEAPVNF